MSWTNALLLSSKTENKQKKSQFLQIILKREMHVVIYSAVGQIGSKFLAAIKTSRNLDFSLSEK